MHPSSAHEGPRASGSLPDSPEAEAATIYVVDDDIDMRDSLQWLLQSLGLTVRAFGSAFEFLQAMPPDGPGCLIADVCLPGELGRPGMNGIDLQEHLLAHGRHWPVIFMSAHADVPMTVRAMRLGAMDFLEKPFDRQQLMQRVWNAIGEDRRRRAVARHLGELDARMARLTAKDREVLQLLMAGTMNKTMAARLQITERAVEMRRAGVLKKLDVQTVAEAIRLATEYELSMQSRG